MSTVETKPNLYYIENIPVNLNTAVTYWKKLHKDYDNFHNSVIAPNAHPESLAFSEIVKEMWDTTPDVTVQQAFEEKNIEVRRLLFKAIGVIEMFEKLEPKLIDEQIIDKDGTGWDDDNKETRVTMWDKYELYEIEGKKLFPEETSDWRAANATVYAVRCWCSTTGREYWIYVPRHIGQQKNALEAIAWTVQLNITDPEFIYRQGDVILAKHSATSKECRPYHLNAEQYVKLLKAES